jgi:UDP-N-acetylmuramate dehydrogenase
MASGRVALPALITENASLRRHNTFGVEATARWLVRLRLPESMPELLTRAEWTSLPILVMGDGSNILFRRNFDGVVIKQDAQRVEQIEADDDGIVIRAESGRNWHAFVQWTLEHNLSGLENLSLIPGTVGAAPIQNIGAYGVEVETYIEGVEVYDAKTGGFGYFDRKACEFGYRSSLFKRPGVLQRFVITAVRFRFPFETPLVLNYPGVMDELATMGVTQPGAREVSDAICAIRRRKLPDPAVLGNVGSFFKNPMVTDEQGETLLKAFPDMPQFVRRDGGRKLSAGWLIDRLGLRGHREGDAGVADTHALVIVNHGNATGEQLWILAQRINEMVRNAYGITLEPEPLIV